MFALLAIGSGPAGMTLAIKLHEAGKDVIILEGGGSEFSAESQKIYAGEVIGDDYYDLESTRLRYFGGSSNHWAGWCRPLDEFDFNERIGFPTTGWPITKPDLDPYIEPAKEVLELHGSFTDDPLEHGIQRISFLNSNPPVRFGDKYREHFKVSTRLTLCLNANVTGLNTDGNRVTTAKVQDFDGNATKVNAGIFVMACGGIENSRLLLHFNSESKGLLISHSETLGRYWMEHHYSAPGVAVMKERPDERITFALDGLTQAKLGVLNCRLRIQPIPRRGSWAREVANDLACHAPALGGWVFNLMDRDMNCVSNIQASWEQEPQAENRIELSDKERDIFGIPAPVLHWGRGPNDKATLEKSVVHFGEYLARSGLGRLRMAAWLSEGTPDPRDDLLGGWHHMGGTRMSAGPSDGIVDSDLRVWGQENLYVAGSSVFPTGGQANPTFTIVQLSLRLANHLSQRL